MDSVIHELLNNWGLEKIACVRSRRRKEKEGEGDWEEGKRRGGWEGGYCLKLNSWRFHELLGSLNNYDGDGCGNIP